MTQLSGHSGGCQAAEGHNLLRTVTLDGSLAAIRLEGIANNVGLLLSTLGRLKRNKRLRFRRHAPKTQSPTQHFFFWCRDRHRERVLPTAGVARRLQSRDGLQVSERPRAASCISAARRSAMDDNAFSAERKCLGRPYSKQRGYVCMCLSFCPCQCRCLCARNIRYDLYSSGWLVVYSPPSFPYVFPHNQHTTVTPYYVYPRRKHERTHTLLARPHVSRPFQTKHNDNDHKRTATTQQQQKHERNVTAGNEVAGEILREHPEACVECHPLDLASFSSVRAFAKRTKGVPVSAIIHNAGVMAPPYSTTVDGHELTFQVRARTHAHGFFRFRVGVFVFSYLRKRQVCLVMVGHHVE